MMNYKAKAKDSFKTKMNLFIYDLAIQNKTEFTLADFTNYKIEADRVGEYTTVYWQKDRKHLIAGNKNIDDIYHDMVDIRKSKEAIIQECEKHYAEHHFPTIFSEEKLKEFDNQDSCAYCGITKKDIQTLREYRGLRKKHERGWNLELDRLDSNLEYTPSNCVMCCYWCNNAKTDEFTATEFKAIGEVMHHIWQERKKLAMDRRYDERFGEPIPFTKVVMRTDKEQDA